MNTDTGSRSRATSRAISAAATRVFSASTAASRADAAASSFGCSSALAARGVTRRGAAGFAGSAAAVASFVDGVAAPIVAVVIGVIGRSVVATTGSLPNGATPRRGQTKSSARPAGARTGSPLTKHLRRHRVGRQLAVIAAQKIVGFASPLPAQRYNRPGKRSLVRARPARGGRRLDFRLFRDSQSHWSGPHAQPTLHFALDIMGKLSGSGLGEVHAVAGAQSSGLTLNVGARLSVAAVLVDETVPNIDI